jgi:hypothetical protein
VDTQKVKRERVNIVQDNEPKIQLFIKRIEGQRGTELLQDTREVLHEHINGICSRVKLYQARFGALKVRNANLSPEMSGKNQIDSNIQTAWK